MAWNLKRHILNNTHYRVIPQIFIQELGYEAALVLSHFINLADRFPKWFFQQSDRMQYDLQMKRRTLNTAIDKLKDEKMIEVSAKRGAKTKYALNHQNIFDLTQKQVIGYYEQTDDSEKEVIKYTQESNSLHTSELNVTHKDYSIRE